MEFMETLPLLHLQLSNFDELYWKSHDGLNQNHSSNHYHHFKEADKVGQNYNINHNHHSLLHENITSQILEHIKGGQNNSVITESEQPLTEVLDELPLRLPMWGVVILIIGYSVVFLMGIVGNFFVLLIITKYKRFKSITNHFIYNLAIADLLVLLFCLLPNLVSNIYVPWILGPAPCKIVPYIQGVSVCASIYFLVAISLERVVTIIYPFKQISKSTARIIIGIIWSWSCIFALPWALFFHYGAFDEENPNLEFCIENWPKEYQALQNFYFLFGNLFLCYGFPLGVILVCYVIIYLRVYKRSLPSESYHVAIDLIYKRSKAAIIKMLIVVVCCFAFSYFFLYVIIIRVKFFSDSMSTLEASIISFAYPISQWLLCLNSSINPIIYSFLNSKFRTAFMQIIKGNRKTNKIPIKKHKSATVNILLKRFSTYRVETTVSNNNNKENSYDSI